MDKKNEVVKDTFDMDELRKRIKDELKKELLDEIRRELKYEEKTSDSIKAEDQDLVQETPAPTAPPRGDDNIIVSLNPILKIATHAFKYANSNIPRNKWVEVIGLLAGKLDLNGHTLYLEDAYPMGHGTAVYAEIKDYKNYVRAYQDIKKKNLFVCGWYHSHPSYGLFMSMEDFGTQIRYQKLWDRSIALVIDPYLIDGTSLGFQIFSADLKVREWFSIPFVVKDAFNPSILPDLLKFIYPIVEGKALYLEYDEE
jgi:proteasome lid subunit RPN8/RPN11